MAGEGWPIDGTGNRRVSAPTLKSRWVLWRNAMLASPRFQRWAARTPLVRRIARQRAAAQFDLVAGFVYSQIVLAHVESGLIELLAGRLQPFDAIVESLGLERAACDRLLRAGRALQLVESPEPGLWTLGEAGAPLSSNSGALAMIRHHPLLYADLADPLALLAKGRKEETALSAYWSYASKAGADRDAAAPAYSALMAATQPMVAQQICDAYDFAQHRRMLDIGGGSGGFALRILEEAPALQVGIFDLPEVIAGTAQRLAGPVTEGRVRLHGGSFKHESLPAGHDLITLVRILHDHDDDVVSALLARVHAALPPGGRVLIVEPLADSAGAPRMGDAYFGLYLWAMGSGRPRSASELRAMLAGAGFSRIAPVPTALPLVASAILATK